MWPKYKCLLPYSFIVLIRVINVRIYCWWYDYRNVLLSPNAAMVFWDPVVVGRPRCCAVSCQVGKWTHQCPRSAARVPGTPRTRQGCGIHATGGGNGDWSCMLCFHVSMLAIVNTQWWDQYRSAGCMCCLQYENNTMHVIRRHSGAYSLELQQSIH